MACAGTEVRRRPWVGGRTVGESLGATGRAGSATILQRCFCTHPRSSSVTALLIGCAGAAVFSDGSEEVRDIEGR